MNADLKLNYKIYWSKSFWTKWQIVIPKWLRELLWLKDWENVIMYYETTTNSIWFIKQDDFWNIL